MLKALLCIVVVILISNTNSYAQQFQHEDKIIAFYGQQRFSEFQQTNPALLDLMDKYIDHGFYVQDVNSDKYLEFTPLQNIALASKNGDYTSISDFLADYGSTQFNPLNYSFFPTSEVQIFKLAGVNKIIYILPQSAIVSQ
jgi:hypothetical protein